MDKFNGISLVIYRNLIAPNISAAYSMNLGIMNIISQFIDNFNRT